MILTGDINSKPCTLISVYTHNSHHLQLLLRVFKLIDEVKYGQLLMYGDFNLTVDQFMDSGSSTKGQSASLRGLFHTDGVYDVWSCQHANERDYIFFSSRHHTYSRMDLFVSYKKCPPLSQTLLGQISVISVMVKEQDWHSGPQLWWCNIKITTGRCHLWRAFLSISKNFLP